ncbi:PREDICTED: uncharacterized protein LOC106750106 isoform X2 [Dinoponera quadriceps]|uniref:Uncharacterized protein LOC106750106 isoform X2 n=1 Tax=Dinoponera quadriceps TaxID=609295 RepID=A0A6P3Y4C2_DINQU|nr:PREDICTED: uncharacterized protein LOC106750106 isoform X2 [Dinoponera quadriceps]
MIHLNDGDDYNKEKSYDKEEKLTQEKVDLTSTLEILSRDQFLNIEPSAIDVEQDAVNVTDEENRGNVTLPEQDIIIRSPTVESHLMKSNLLPKQRVIPRKHLM